MVTKLVALQLININLHWSTHIHLLTTVENNLGSNLSRNILVAEVDRRAVLNIVKRNDI